MHRLAVFTALFLLTVSNLRAQLNIYYINVGQGDATYIELPNGKNVLIDAGPSGEIIEKFLQEKNVTMIDYLVLTHPHNDHYLGMKKVFANTEVNNFYDTRMDNTGADGDNEIRDLAKKEPACRTHYPKPGENLNWASNVTVKVLNSCPDPVESAKNDEINDCSIVLRLFYNGTGLLFSGDAESPIEDAIMKNFKSGLESYALKVAHHGSRFTSTEAFLKRVQPQVAIVSVGVNNVFGHPHKEAIDRLRATGAKIYFTTRGTQTLVIPAPKKGVEPVMQGPVPYDPLAVAQPPAVRNVVYTPEVQAPVSVNSEALDQLKQAVPAN